jgi:hypothetical protein
MPLGSVIIVSVSSGFDEGFVFACGGNFDGADIAVIINIGLLSGNSC